MKNDFRKDVKDLAGKSLNLLDQYFSGGPADPAKIRAAIQTLSFGVKVEHMDQLKDHGDKSLALRLFQFLPKDEHIRKEYLKITNPQIKPLLLAKPKK